MYDVLADWYDRFQEIDYDAFADGYEALFARFGIQPHLVLDLGCGTGTLTVKMAERGYEMIGLDASEEMLRHASDKAATAGQEILFLHQDMTEFELYGTVDAMISTLDGVNYLTEDGDLEAMFRLLHYYLNPGGILIFDVNTPYKFREVLDGHTFVYEDDNAFCVWENELDGNLCYFDLTFFLQNPDGTYTRKEEYQQERVYTEPEIRAAAKRCGLTFLGVRNAPDGAEADPTCERVFYIIQRPNTKEIRE